MTKPRTFRPTPKEEIDSSGWTAVAGQPKKNIGPSLPSQQGGASSAPKDKARLFDMSDMDAKDVDAVKAKRAKEKTLMEEHRRKQVDVRYNAPSLSSKSSSQQSDNAKEKEGKYQPLFDRERDMQSIGMSVSAVKRTIQNASQLNDRFASSSTKSRK